MKRLLYLLLFVSLSLQAAETGYRIVHPDGSVEFTDDPTRGGEPIELREAPTIQSVKPSPPESTQRETSAAGDSQAGGVQYESLQVTSPEQGQTLWFDGSSIQVSVQVSPALGEGDQIVLLLDGQEVARGSGTGFSLPQVYRGTHTLEARIVDSADNQLLQSSPVTFYMRQHSVR